MYAHYDLIGGNMHDKGGGIGLRGNAAGGSSIDPIPGHGAA